jgi:hypothetical protein
MSQDIERKHRSVGIRNATMAERQTRSSFQLTHLIHTHFPLKKRTTQQKSCLSDTDTLIHANGLKSDRPWREDDSIFGVLQ